MSRGNLVDALRKEAGDALRSVGEYDRQEKEILYILEDVETIYSQEEVDNIFDDLALQGLSRRHLEDLFDAGSLTCAMFKFDDALMFHFPETDYTGLFVTVDTGSDLDLESFVETCKGGQ